MSKIPARRLCFVSNWSHAFAAMRLAQTGDQEAGDAVDRIVDSAGTCVGKLDLALEDLCEDYGFRFSKTERGVLIQQPDGGRTEMDSGRVTGPLRKKVKLQILQIASAVDKKM